MTLKQALAVLAANDAATEGTFMHALHERARFDKATFWPLYTAAVIIGEAPPRARGTDTRRHAFHVYQHVLQSIIHHFNSRDSFRIRGLPGRTLSAYLARLEWALEPLIMGKRGYGWAAEFSDGLENPDRAALMRRFSRRTKARSKPGHKLRHGREART